MKPIPGWPGYHADEDGNIWSTHGRTYVGGLTWAPTIGHAPRRLAQFDRKSARGKPTPYRSVCMKRDDKPRNMYVHHLVALTFLGPRPEGAEILHGKEGSTVNALSNLRYGTPEENSAERVLCSGDAWYRARGLEPPHAFADLIEEGGTAA